MYRKTGFYAKPANQVILQAALDVYNINAGGTGFEAPLGLIIKQLGREARFLTTLTPVDLFMANDSSVYVPGTPQHEAFTTLMSHWATSLGLPFFTQPAAEVDYTVNYRLTIDECVDRIIASKVTLPDMSSVGGERATFETLRFAVPSIVRGLQSLQYMRPIVASRLRRKLQDLAFRLAKGGELNQFEKSFFLCFYDVNSVYGACTYLGETPGGNNPGFAPVENNDELVNSTFNELVPLVEQGPSLRFVRWLSSASHEHLVAMTVPSNPNMKFGVAALVKYGPYASQFVERAQENVRWDERQYESAVRQRLISPTYGSASSAMGYVSPTIHRVPSTSSWVPDLPQVKIVLQKGIGTIVSPSTVFLEWPSTWRGRVCSTEQGFPVSAIEIDMLLKNKTVGECAIDHPNITDWSSVTVRSLGRLSALGKYDDAKSVATEATIYMPNTSTRTVDPKTVSLDVALQQTGFSFIRPAFCEFYRMGTESLLEPQPALEQAVAQKLNLIPTDLEQARMAIRISLNNFLITRRFGSSATPAINIENYIKAVTGLK